MGQFDGCVGICCIRKLIAQRPFKGWPDGSRTYGVDMVLVNRSKWHTTRDPVTCENTTKTLGKTPLGLCPHREVQVCHTFPVLGNSRIERVNLNGMPYFCRDRKGWHGFIRIPTGGMAVMPTLAWEPGCPLTMIPR